MQRPQIRPLTLTPIHKPNTESPDRRGICSSATPRRFQTASVLNSLIQPAGERESKFLAASAIISSALTMGCGDTGNIAGTCIIGAVAIGAATFALYKAFHSPKSKLTLGDFISKLQPSSTIDDVRALLMMTDNIDSAITLWQRAIDLKLVKSVGEFTALCAHGCDSQCEDYQRKMDGFIAKNLDLFFSLTPPPTLAQIKQLRRSCVSYVQTSFSVMQMAIDRKMVGSVGEFVDLCSYECSNPNGAYKETMGNFIIKNLDCLFEQDPPPTVADIKSFERRSINHVHAGIAIMQKAIDRKIVVSVDDFIALCAYGCDNPNDNYKKAMGAFITKNMDCLFDLSPAPTIAQLIAFSSQSIQYVSEGIGIRQKAIDRKIVRSVDDFIALCDYSSDSHIHGYRQAMSTFIQRNIAHLFGFNPPPTISQLKKLERQSVTHVGTNVALMQKAVDVGTVKSMADFFRLIEYVVSSPSAAYRDRVDAFIKSQLGFIFSLSPSKNEIMRLIRIFTAEVESHVALAQRAVNHGTIKTPSDFIEIFEPNGPNPGINYRNGMARLAILNLPHFAQLHPEKIDIINLGKLMMGTRLEEAYRSFSDDVLTTPEKMVEVAEREKAYYAWMEDWATGKLFESSFDLVTYRRLQKYDPDTKTLILTMLDMVHPMSSRSFVNTGDKEVELLDKLIAVGDTQEHLPTAWRNRDSITSTIYSQRWVSDKSSLGDPECTLERLHTKLKDAVERRNEKQPAIAELALAIEAGIRSENFEGALDILIRLGGCEEEIYTSINVTDLSDYGGIETIDDYCSPKGPLGRIISCAFKLISPEQLIIKGEDWNGTREILRAQKVASLITGIWNGEGSASEKRARILSILIPYRRDEITAKLLTDETLDGALKAMIETIVQGDAPMSIAALQELMLGPIKAAIEMERGRFSLVQGEEMTVGIRPCKSLGDGLYGRSAGICVGDRIEIWKDPKFRLFSITDESAKKIVGYVQTYERTIHKVPTLVIVGINPSHEFLQQIDPEALYDSIINAAMILGKEARYKQLIIPINPFINSNRPKYQRMIRAKCKEWKTIKIDPAIKWTSSNDYQITEAYVTPIE